jgi:hypothetical protein
MAKRAKTGPTFIQRSRGVSPQQKAIYHNVVGAGRSRVKREFFDLSDEDSETIVEFLERRLLASDPEGGARG